MAWSPPTTVAVNDTHSASRWNTQVKANLEHLHETHGPIWIPAGGFIPDGTATQVYDATVKAGAINFPDASTTEAVAFGLVPADWISGGITFTLYLQQRTAGTGNARFQIEYQFVSDAEVLAAGTALGPTDIAVPGTLNAEKLQAFTATAAPSAGELIKIVVSRIGAHANDTFAGNVGLSLLKGAYV